VTGWLKTGGCTGEVIVADLANQSESRDRARGRARSGDLAARTAASEEPVRGVVLKTTGSAGTPIVLKDVTARDDLASVSRCRLRRPDACKTCPKVPPGIENQRQADLGDRPVLAQAAPLEGDGKQLRDCLVSGTIPCLHGLRTKPPCRAWHSGSGVAMHDAGPALLGFCDPTRPSDPAPILRSFGAIGGAWTDLAATAPLNLGGGIYQMPSAPLARMI